jgi:putative transposase
MKKYTAFRIRTQLEQAGQIQLLEQLRFPRRKQVFKIWEDRFDDVVLKTNRVFLIKLNYIHLNPLQAHWNLVNKPEDWKYSSAGFYETGVAGPVLVTDYREYF